MVREFTGLSSAKASNAYGQCCHKNKATLSCGLHLDIGTATTTWE
jgi:hypothetical protein